MALAERYLGLDVGTKRIGVAAGVHVSGSHVMPNSNRSDAAIDVYDDGRVRVRFGGSDAGTGQRTILAQIVAEELDLSQIPPVAHPPIPVRTLKAANLTKVATLATMRRRLRRSCRVP